MPTKASEYGHTILISAMTSTRYQLRAMKACNDALDWIGERTIEQAWRECRRGDWMCWLLLQIAHDDPRCRLATADFAERAWCLIADEPTRLAAAWAIAAARRGDEDEMRAASMAADAARADAAAYAAAAYASAASAAYAAADAAASAAYAAEHTAESAYSAAARSFAAAYAAESAAQADILRQYFSAREVGDLFRQAPA